MTLYVVVMGIVYAVALFVIWAIINYIKRAP